MSNYLPIKANGKATTPFYLANGQQPDYRTLFPLFSIAYIRRTKDNTTERTKMQAKSLRTIAVGRCTKSNGLLFYHPPSQQLLSSTDYILDPTLTSGPTFKLQYEGGIFFNTYDDISDRKRPPTYAPESTVYVPSVNNPSIHERAVVLAIPDKYLHCTTK